MSARVVCWFSAGAASAAATKLAIAEHGDRAVIVRIDPGSEHTDNERFARDCADWFGREIIELRSDKYDDTWAVWAGERYLVGVSGAPCTRELKRRVRFGFERPDDVQVFGYTAEEKHRAARFREQNPGITLATPLIDHELTKADTLAIVERAGIELPAMYQLGYHNNNCIGCPKGGMGYWNKIRVDFPDVFDRMSKLERDIGASVLSEDDPERPGRTTRRVWLDELDPDRGDYPTEIEHDCSLMCAIAEGVIA